MDAEATFLQQLQASGDTDYIQSGESAQPQQTYDDEDDEEDYDPSALIPEPPFHAVDRGASSQRPQALHSTTPNNAPAPSAMATVAEAPIQPSSRPPSTAQNQRSDALSVSSKQPRTVGGFIVDDDDEEDETPSQRTNGAGANALLGVARSTSTPQRSVSKTPNNNASSNVQISNDAQDQAVTEPVVNGPADAVSAPAIPVPVPDQEFSKQGSEEKAHQIIAPAKVSNSVPPNPNTSLSKTRLPNDRVGILEDRIAEDPRGDVDAWLSLINEYRDRSKIEDARAVYDRFLKIFPTAVSPAFPVHELLLTLPPGRTMGRICEDGARQRLF